MYLYYKHKDINFNLWDDCIQNSKNGIIYALSWYLNIVSPEWDAIIKLENGKYVSILPVTHFKKFGIKYLKTPEFCQQLGLFYTGSLIDVELIEILEILKSKFSLISNYSLNSGNQINFYNSQVKISLGITYHLNLSNSYLNLFGNFKSDKRQKINRAKRRGIIVEATENIEILIALFRENISHKIYGGVNNYQYDLLRKLYQEANNRGVSMLLASYSKNKEIISISLFYKWNNFLIYFFSATTPEGRKHNGIESIINFVIEKYSNSGFTLDFEGSFVPGIEEFYSRFGSHKIIYPIINSDTHPWLIKKVKGWKKIIAGNSRIKNC